MAAPDTERQKDARNRLDTLFDNAFNVFVVHYSCESLHDRSDGRSPRITSIAVRNLENAQTESFSIHKIAEIRGVPFTEISEYYNCLEKEMLRDFYHYLAKFQQMQYMHWNMRDSSYGFQAIEHRFRVLGGKAEEIFTVDDKNKTDLSRLLIDIYGLDYVGHPRLESLLEKNGISRRDFLPGADEPKAFEEKNFVRLHQSTLRKVDVIANIAGRAHDRNSQNKRQLVGHERRRNKGSIQLGNG